MKKKIVFIILLLAIIISIVGLVYINKDKKDKKSKLDEIKEEVKATNKIYVCKQSDDPKNVCRDKDLVKIIDDKEKIKEFIDIFETLNVENGPETMIKDSLTLYLLDVDDKIILSVDFPHHFIVKRIDYVRHLSTEYNDKLKSILEI